DLVLDDDSWDAIATSHPEHPQFGLARLLKGLDASRGDVRILQTGEAGNAEPFATRTKVLSEMMRPAPSTDQWHTLRERVDLRAVRAALADVTQLVAPSSQDEAEAIALILREVADTPGQTAALISPDRLLARRVAIRLEGWGIRVDDSAGRPFGKTVPGSFLDLVVAAAADAFAAKALMALLKHPLTRLEMPAAEIRRAGRAVEIIAFRTAYLGYGLDGIEAAIERAIQEVQGKQRRGQAVARLWDEDWQAARNLVQRLRQAYAPLEALAKGQKHELRSLADAHIKTAEALARRSPEDTETNELWRDEAGQTAALLFSNLMDETLQSPQISVDEYPDFYRALIAAEAVRPTIPTHPRIFIWGPFEARLQQPDVVILGALNEGTWPSTADPGPWLNRPMRQELGLPLPEEQIGYAAHDLVQLFGAGRVYMTRAEKVDGDPSVPSRWLLRLGTVLSALEAQDVLAPRRPWLAWARSRDLTISRPPIAQPAPCPPVEMRPRRLSVSAIETWIANPYAIFAERILRLEALPQLGADPGADLRGSIVHEALGQFASRHPNALPAAPAAELLAIATDIFSTYNSHPRIRAFWIERFRRFAEWFGAQESSLRDGALVTLAEINGAHVINGPAGPFTLTARADRIDSGQRGLIITDYKTGANLDVLATRASTAMAPQLLLEAVIAIAGGFSNVPAGRNAVQALRYISASGGEPPGAVKPIKLDDIASAAAEVEARLAELIASFDDPLTPYRALRRGSFSYDYDGFAHLARVDEWTAGNAEATT
ncbi:MAG TPA: double-strand break repair protein AddB, partial [Hyphomicrobiaceae bacterium]|nr:double-strand break repair protein AddB [Hyphomicrobiaceae bacterium]